MDTIWKKAIFLFDWSSSIILMVKNSMLCDPLLSQNSYNFGDIYQKVAEEGQLHHSILSVYFYFKIHGVLYLYKHHYNPKCDRTEIFEIRQKMDIFNQRW